ncbi:MAG: amino acid adenylation domain-containing protein [Polyangiaceae bacterium]|nr:amino acid adenylation domain-containing protein [Polyangiaceae bacterium]
MTETDDTFSLSPLQAPFWWAYQVDPSSTALTAACTFRIFSPLDLPSFDAAWRAVVGRHGALRTAFGGHGDDAFQRVLPAGAAGARVVPVEGLDEAELAARVQAEYRRPIDLERGPPADVTLFRRADDEYVFLIRAHHIAADLAGIMSAVDELFREYAARRAGGEAAIAPPTRQYREFVREQEAYLASDAAAASLAYWAETLAGAPPESTLAADRPRPSAPVLGGRALAMPVASAEVARRLREFCRREGASPFRVALAAFYATLYHHSGQGDLSVGTFVSCRGAAFADLVGHLANNVALRVRCDDATTFRALVAATAQAVDGAIQHKDVPFSHVVRRLAPPRERNRLPLFQVSFQLNRMPQRPELAWTFLDAEQIRPWRGELEGVRVGASVPLPTMVGPHDLQFYLSELDGELLASVRYNADMFDRATIERFGEHFGVLLAAALEAPDLPMGDLPSMGEGERRQIVETFNATARRGEGPATADALVAARAARAPGAVAIIDGDRTVRYDELERRATAAAQRLRAAGVGPGARVAIYLPRSAEFVVAILGVLKTGAAYVPLDVAYPPERLQLIVDDARPSALVTEPGLLPPLAGPPVVSLGASLGEGDAAPPASSPNALAYVIYTSGSTGKPKGVLIDHRALCNLVEGFLAVCPVGPDDVVLGFSPFGFDVSVGNVFVALAAGATLHLGTDEALKGGPALADLLEREAITFCALPPAVWATMPARELPALRTGVSTAEACSHEIVRKWCAPGRRFFNFYGPTEVTIWATFEECAPERPPTIGRPLANYTAYVLDGTMRPRPLGVPGELYLGGPSVGTGYLGRPALTADRFVPDPFGPPGSRLYRSGDFTRQLPDGTIDYLGRRDNQVKVRGVRIELEEVEDAVRRHPEVAAAAVAVRQRGAGGRARLVAYVVPAREGLSLDAVRAFVATRLPDAFVPTRFVAIPTLPLTANAKVDRSALPPDEADDAADDEAPESAAADDAFVGAGDEDGPERAVHAAFRRALGVAHLEPNENFFNLGGDSVLALETTYQLGLALGRDVPVSALLLAPTVAGLSAQLGRAASSAMVALGPATKGAPSVYCIHPTGGDVGPYRALAALVRGRCNCYGVPDAGGDESTVEQLAARHAAAIVAHAPAGPIALAGWSFGGVVAAAIAHLLEASGREVSLVALYDAAMPSSVAGVEHRYHSFFFDLAADLGPLGVAFVGLDPSARGRLGEELLARPADERFARAFEAAKALGLPVASSVEAYASARKLFRSHEAMIHEHRPRPVRAPVEVWWARATLDDGIDPATWAPYAARCRVDAVEGNHFSVMRRPRVDILAESLARALAPSFRHDVTSSP